MNDEIELKSIQDYNNHLGVDTLHPLASVVDFSQLETIKHGKKQFGFYCVVLKQLECGTLMYGRNQYDYQEGTMVFIAPGQLVGNNDGGETRNPKGWVLMFHPDLLYGTPLARRIKDYSFFSYDSNEALHMSERERQIIINCFKEIKEELEHVIDKHSKQIISANIEVMLNHCVRFYDRQFVMREISNHGILSRFEKLLAGYFDKDLPQTIGLPSVQYCAEQLHLSSNYFGDLIKKETGKTAQEYVQFSVINMAKDLLISSDKSISEIAYHLGFKYPHHLSRMFKKVAGVSPQEFRVAS
ncbi:MAG: AraC family transcriptional regulator [Tannerellaceae bacterium]